MLRVVLIRAGETDFDQQGRLQGQLDLPLSAPGRAKVLEIAQALRGLGLRTLHASPCQAAQQTAELIGAELSVKVRTVEQFANVDYGLWHGMLIEEFRQRQPRVYRQLQEHPETACPPGGEPLSAVQQRVAEALDRLIRKQGSGVLGIVLPEPLTSFAKAYLDRTELSDLWKAEQTCCGWCVVELSAAPASSS